MSGSNSYSSNSYSLSSSLAKSPHKPNVTRTSRLEQLSKQEKLIEQRKKEIEQRFRSAAISAISAFQISESADGLISSTVTTSPTESTEGVCPNESYSNYSYLTSS